MKAILEQALPREMSATLVDDLEKSAAKAGENFVTPDGDFSFGDTLFVGGKTNVNEKNTSLLAFKRELRELESAAQKLDGQIKKSQIQAGKAGEILAEREDKLVDLQSFIVKAERELLSIEMQAQTLAQEVERAARHQKVVGEESAQIETEFDETAAKQKEAKRNADLAAKAQNEATKNSAKVALKLSDAREKLNAENLILGEKRTAAATAGERRRSTQTALRRVENEQTELESRFARQNLEIVETENKTADLEKSIRKIAEKIAVSSQEETGEQNELAEMSAHLKLARETADQMSSELAGLNKKSAEARNERAAIEIKQAETMTRLKNLNEKCVSELNMPLAELVEIEETPEDFDAETSRANLEDLRDKIENFGAINMLALEELAEAEERLTFLTAQRQDIIDGIAATEAALKEIKERSRERFKEAFYAINRNFVEFFQELFGGGRGEMTLLEAEDVLESGIEIVAQPPGKRLQNILLLSGGEKAMTAIALVMAIFQYRPAPFCLLDEVDAPLDDANVGRFVNKIAEMSEKTQFIVITHNKRTMEAAKALYGVTMQEAGVSKIVSVRFE